MIEILIGVVSGIVSGTGMGGGTILIFLLTFLMGVEQHIAQATNLIFFVPTSIVAIIVNLKNKNIYLKSALIISIFGILGAIIGANISINMDVKILKRLFMGKSEIEVTQKSATESDQYVLKRNGEPAHHLSEGEKTAISFAHFIASLESKDLLDKYGEIILYIDDPISSLDNNHIYAVYAEIEKLRTVLKNARKR